MKILVLGARGFIGQHIVEHFIETGYTVTGCDLSEDSGMGYEYVKLVPAPNAWDDLLKAHRFDFCINAAGSGNVAYSIQHPFEDFNANTVDPFRVLEALRKSGDGCKYIHISSAAIYGNPLTLPVSETDPCRPVSPYGYHKWMSELICREYHHLYGTGIAILRPFSVYGERQQKQLLWDTCKKLAASDTVTLFGTGRESRDFIHVMDFSRLIGCIIKHGSFDATVYNAATGIETTIQEIANLFMHCFKGQKTIHFSGEVRQGDPLNWRADIAKSLTTGFKPRISIQEGIAKYKKWFDGQNG